MAYLEAAVVVYLQTRPEWRSDRIGRLARHATSSVMACGWRGPVPRSWRSLSQAEFRCEITSGVVERETGFEPATFSLGS
jgi:hypothetical protein